jgi:hypothetical protein
VDASAAARGVGMRIKNWERFQHYKSGRHSKRPDWIKLYRRCLDDIQFHCLSDRDTKVLVMLWMLAGETGGELPPLREIAFRLRRSEAEINEAIQGLGHFIEGIPSVCLDSGYTSASPEEEEEEEEEENKNIVGAKAPYGFRGLVVKLSVADYERWKAAFKQIDLDAELNARDAWLADTPSRQSNWFASTSKYLANRNAEAKARASPLRSSVSSSPFMEAGRALLEELEHAASDKPSN